MGLKEQLLEFQEKFIKSQKPEVIDMLVAANEEIFATDLVSRALPLGAEAPDFSLVNPQKQLKTFSDIRGENGLIISFYRGNWCPYCNIELTALQGYLSEFKKLRVNLAAVSPESPDQSLSTQEINHLSFEVLSDSQHKTITDFGLDFRLPESYHEAMAMLGIDLKAFYGKDPVDLAVPATYVLDKNRHVIQRFVDMDYSLRLDPEDIINFLQKL